MDQLAVILGFNDLGRVYLRDVHAALPRQPKLPLLLPDDALVSEMWKGLQDVSPKICPTSSEHPRGSSAQRVLKMPHMVSNPPQDRDVLLYAERATFHNPRRNHKLANCS